MPARKKPSAADTRSAALTQAIARTETAEAARDEALRLVAIASSRIGAFRAQRDEAVAVLAAMLADVDPLLSDVTGSWASMVRARALVEQYRRTTTERAAYQQVRAAMTKPWRP